MKNIIFLLVLMFSFNCGFSQKLNNEISSGHPVFGEGYYIDTFLKENPSNNINFLKSSVYIFFNNGSVLLCNLGIYNTDSANFASITKRILLKNFYGVSWGKFNI